MAKQRAKTKYFDYSLLVIILFLVCFGLVMVYSTSYYSGMKLPKNPDPAFYLKKQVKSTILGMAAFVFCIFFDYKYYYKLAPWIYAGAVFSILLILTPLGVEINHARRWINVGFGTIQPAEICKLAVIISVSAYIVMTGKAIDKFRNLIVVAVLTLIPTGMILVITKNLSSAIIVFGIGFVIYFVATKRYWPFALMAVFGAAGIAAFILYIHYYVDPVTAGVEIDEDTGFRMMRILAWRHPEEYASGKGYQTLQALYALGSGGFFGKGLGESIQKLGFIPEAQNDMIFSVVCEELGLFGGICLILLFGMMIWRFVIIALHSPDMFGFLLVVGVTAHIAIQVILNIAVVTNLIPNTGITLPFISYGGTSVMFLLAEMGIVLNVSRHIKYRHD